MKPKFPREFANIIIYVSCRTNIGNANLFGLSVDLHLTTNQYAACLALFFMAYVLFEVPSNMVSRGYTEQIAFLARFLSTYCNTLQPVHKGHESMAAI